jgi:antitoxin component YwqK of YwqJK toxin-antitoxin module
MDKPNIISYYLNGQLDHKGTIINNLQQGFWLSYYPNGLLAYKGRYLNDKKIGLWLSRLNSKYSLEKIFYIN